MIENKVSQIKVVFKKYLKTHKKDWEHFKFPNKLVSEQGFLLRLNRLRSNDYSINLIPPWKFFNHLTSTFHGNRLSLLENQNDLVYPIC